MADTDDSAMRGSVERIMRKFTQGDRDFVKVLADTPVGATRPKETDENRITANLQTTQRIVSLILNEAKEDAQVTRNRPSYDAALLKELMRKLSDLLQGPGPFGSTARTALQEWAKGPGKEAYEVYAVVLNQIVERAREMAKDQQAALAAAQQPPVRTIAPLTNAEALSAALRAKKQQAVPVWREGDTGRTRKGDVKSVLVVNGKEYHGANGNGGSVSAVTKAVIKLLTDSGQEEWAIVGCAEVSALDKYVTKEGLTTVEAVLTAFRTGTAQGALIGTISLYGQSATEPGYWDLRQPCRQCQQWLKSLTITPRTDGARS